MSAQELTTLSPLLVTGCSAVMVMLVAALFRRHTMTAVLTVAGLASALVATLATGLNGPAEFGALLTVDGYARFFVVLILASAIVVTVLAHGYLSSYAKNRDELYVLLLVATLGALVLACSTHLATFFLGLETLTVGLYGMIAYSYFRQRPLEAGIKYLVLAATSSAFLLFGMALAYAASGTMRFDRLLANPAGPGSPLLVAGTALVVVGVGFKLALVPFHLWVADVYQGAPAPVTAFLATVSKGAVFALLLRYFQPRTVPLEPLFVVFVLAAIASMLGGNLLALLQSNVKRILAYSSVAHMGYVLVAFLAGGTVGHQAAALYLVAYFITTLGAFGVVTLLSRPDGEAEEIDDYRSLFWRRPALAGVFTLMLLSLAGIPLTAGFVGKFYLLAAGASASLWPLVLGLVVASTIGLFYYLRVIVAIYEPLAEQSPAPRPARLALPGVLAVGALTAWLLWIGLYPAPMLDVVAAAVRRL